MPNNAESAVARVIAQDNDGACQEISGVLTKSFAEIAQTAATAGLVGPDAVNGLTPQDVKNLFMFVLKTDQAKLKLGLKVFPPIVDKSIRVMHSGDIFEQLTALEDLNRSIAGTFAKQTPSPKKSFNFFKKKAAIAEIPGLDALNIELFTTIGQLSASVAESIPEIVRDARTLVTFLDSKAPEAAEVIRTLKYSKTDHAASLVADLAEIIAQRQRGFLLISMFAEGFQVLKNLFGQDSATLSDEQLAEMARSTAEQIEQYRNKAISDATILAEKSPAAYKSAMRIVEDTNRTSAAILTATTIQTGYDTARNALTHHSRLAIIAPLLANTAIGVMDGMQQTAESLLVSAIQGKKIRFGDDDIQRITKGPRATAALLPRMIAMDNSKHRK